MTPCAIWCMAFLLNGYSPTAPALLRAHNDLDNPKPPNSTRKE
jgi:hypothetical protein